MPAATIDTLEIAIQVQSDDAEKRLDRFLEKLRAIGSATNGAGTVSARIRDIVPDNTGLDTTAKKVEQIGEAASRSGSKLSRFSKDLRESGAAATHGASGLSRFWESVKRIVTMRAIRAAIRAVTGAIREGVQNMYTWSTTTGNEFANTMNSLATSANYLKNSLGAMAAPLLNALAPALNTIINLVVEALNALNMLFAAFSGADTYTVAVRTSATFANAVSNAASDASSAVSNAASNATDAVSNAIDDMKRTIMGFDEINKLSDIADSASKHQIGSSSGGTSGAGGGGTGGGGIAFVEKPLEGFFKDLADLTSGWPDWLKWLFGIGSVAIAAWGISQLPKLIGKIFDAFKNLFTITIPDWLRWLFGPKGDDDIGINIPDHIDLPDGNIDVDINLKNTPEDLFDQFKKDWLALDGRIVYVTPQLNNTAKTIWNNFKKDWDDNKSTLYATPSLNNTGKTLFDTFKKSWDDNKSTLCATPSLNNTGKTLFDTFKKSWNDNRSTLYATPSLNNTGKALFKAFKNNWNDNRSTLYATPALNNTGKAIWKAFKKDWNDNKSTLYATPSLSNTAKAIWKDFKKAWDKAKSDLKASVIVETKGNGGAIQGGGGQTSGGGVGRSRHALGGIVTANSESWFKNISIPRYEFGTTHAHGTLFLAGEAGPEIIGHVGGRTEILNKSQLAATMYSAVHSAMRGVKLDANVYSESGNGDMDYDTMYRAMYNAFSAALARGDERDREKLALMREIAAKDFNPEITAASINRAQTRMNRRAGTTIVPVGT